MRSKNLAVVAMFAVASSAWAGPVNYNEAQQGDLSSTSIAVLSIGTGVNTIQGITGFGSLAEETPRSFGGDRDPFVLHVGTGLHIERATLTMLPIGGTVFGSSWLVVRDGDFGNPIADLGQSYSVYTQSWLVDFGPGDYLFHHWSLGGDFDSSWSFRWDIQASEAAASLPEPSTMALLLVSVAAAGTCRWRPTRHRPTLTTFWRSST